MNRCTIVQSIRLSLMALLLCSSGGVLQAQATSFTYQGRLTDGGNPATGAYDLQFRLFDALVSGNQVGSTVIRDDVAVSNGIFTVYLDFGGATFPGANRWLEIAVRPGASTGAFTALSPLQPITSTPYTVQSLNATNATTAVNFSGALGGDVTGNQSATAVMKLRNVSLPAPAGADNGKVLKYKNNGVDPITLEWATDNAGGVTNVTASGALASSGGVTPNISLTGIIQLANGGTGLSSSGTTGNYLRSAGSNWTSSPLQAIDLPAGSANYIQNATNQQGSSNFNVTGNGLIGGNLGIGTTSPGFRLDVADRMRVRQGSPAGPLNTAGVWFYQAAVGDRAFVGMLDDTHVGLAGGGVGWALVMNTTTGNVGIGDTDASGGYRLNVVGGSNRHGVAGSSNFGTGVTATSNSGSAVFAQTASSTATDAAVLGWNTSIGYAGIFYGRVKVTGLLEKPGGGFKIDHPLEPKDKYLIHSFVESPDMKNLYDGTVTTDAKGEAEITLPEWFEALNRDFRYQLTCIGVFAQAIIAEEIKDHRFKIRTSSPQVKVSWQVTGIRQDAWANQNRLPVEELKPEVERGRYQNPSAFGQPEEKSIESARHPEQMRQMNERREKAGRGISQTPTMPLNP